MKTVTRAQFIRANKHLAGMNPAGASGTLDRWISSGRIKTNADGTINEDQLENYQTRQPEIKHTVPLVYAADVPVVVDSTGPIERALNEARAEFQAAIGAVDSATDRLMNASDQMQRCIALADAFVTGGPVLENVPGPSADVANEGHELADE